MLRLVTTPAPAPPLPSVEHLHEHAIRRPGELHERLDLATPLLRRAEGAAQRAGLGLGLAAALLVEAALVRVDLAAIGAVVESELDRIASIAHVRRPMSAAEADYVSTLRGPGFARTLPTVPVRLVGRLGAIDLERALAADAAQAARWEAAALLEGRTMLEWALMGIAAGR
jgi:hypothetical protein